MYCPRKDLILVVLLCVGISSALVCRECSTNCMNNDEASNRTCGSGLSRCIKLDFGLYVHRGCARTDNCKTDGSGIDENGNEAVSRAWRRAKNHVGEEHAKSLVRQGSVIHCCSHDVCNGVSKLAQTFFGLVLSSTFAFLLA